MFVYFNISAFPYFKPNYHCCVQHSPPSISYHYQSISSLYLPTFHHQRPNIQLNPHRTPSRETHTPRSRKKMKFLTAILPSLFLLSLRHHLTIAHPITLDPAPSLSVRNVPPRSQDECYQRPEERKYRCVRGARRCFSGPPKSILTRNNDDWYEYCATVGSQWVEYCRRMDANPLTCDEAQAVGARFEQDYAGKRWCGITEWTIRVVVGQQNSFWYCSLGPGGVFVPNW